MCGLAGILRLGFLANFISEPVLKGFIIGLALTIIIGQVPKLLGVSGSSGDFFERLFDVIGKLGDTHGATLAIGLGSLAVVLALRRLAPMVPGSLVAVALGVGAVELFNLDQHGVDIVGHIDAGLPSIGVPKVLTTGPSRRGGTRPRRLSGVRPSQGSSVSSRIASSASASGSSARSQRQGTPLSGKRRRAKLSAKASPGSRK